MSGKNSHDTENARITFTKKAIKETFLQLAAQKEISKITAVEICKETGINRNTFYSYFYSAEDVFKEIRDEFLSEFDEIVNNDSLTDEETCIGCLRLLYKNIEISKIFFTREENSVYIYELFIRYRKNFFSNFKKLVPNISEKEEEMFLQFFICGVSGVLRTWLNNEYTYSPDDVSGFLIKSIQNGLNGFLNK